MGLSSLQSVLLVSATAVAIPAMQSFGNATLRSIAAATETEPATAFGSTQSIELGGKALAMGTRAGTVIGKIAAAANAADQAMIAFPRVDNIVTELETGLRALGDGDRLAAQLENLDLTRDYLRRLMEVAVGDAAQGKENVRFGSAVLLRVLAERGEDLRSVPTDVDGLKPKDYARAMVLLSQRDEGHVGQSAAVRALYDHALRETIPQFVDDFRKALDEQIKAEGVPQRYLAAETPPPYPRKADSQTTHLIAVARAARAWRSQLDFIEQTTSAYVKQDALSPKQILALGAATRRLEYPFEGRRFDRVLQEATPSLLGGSIPTFSRALQMPDIDELGYAAIVAWRGAIKRKLLSRPISHGFGVLDVHRVDRAIMNAKYHPIAHKGDVFEYEQVRHLVRELQPGSDAYRREPANARNAMAHLTFGTPLSAGAARLADELALSPNPWNKNWFYLLTKPPERSKWQLPITL